MLFNFIILNLTLLTTLFVSETVLANHTTKEINNDDLTWATNMANQATSMVWQELQEKFNAQEWLDANKNSVKLTRRISGLYIFVSSSMPKSLLKSYLAEANNYGGTLVFKGLLDGSFKELSKLIIELTANDISSIKQNEQFGLQIDEEAFDNFSITVVPTIVLAKTQEYLPGQDLPTIYDKITGNVGIKYALEQFSSSGQLFEEAISHLNFGKNDN